MSSVWPVPGIQRVESAKKQSFAVFSSCLVFFFIVCLFFYLTLLFSNFLQTGRQELSILREPL